MKREIKFRVFNKITGHMADVKTISGQYVWDYAVDPVYDSAQRLIDTAYDTDDQAVLMQFTGLKDKNGKDIYEGDVIKGPSGPEKKELAQVIYDSFGVPCLLGVHIYGVMDFAQVGADPGFKALEVIGNIYENPELLRATK